MASARDFMPEELTLPAPAKAAANCRGCLCTSGVRRLFLLTVRRVHRWCFVADLKKIAHAMT